MKIKKVKPERTIVIGATQIDGCLYRSETAEEVEAKIAQAKLYPFSSGLRCDGRPVTWDTYRATLDSLVSYRKIQGTQADGSVRVAMSSRPPLLVVAIEQGQVCQLNHYTGHVSWRWIGSVVPCIGCGMFPILPTNRATDVVCRFLECLVGTSVASRRTC